MAIAQLGRSVVNNSVDTKEAVSRLRADVIDQFFVTREATYQLVERIAMGQAGSDLTIITRLEAIQLSLIDIANACKLKR